MIAYTKYASDGRVRFEAEALAGWGHEVFFLVPKDGSRPRTHILRGVTIKELNVRKYCGKSNFRYLLSYLIFLGLAFLATTRLLLQPGINVVHVHNMPDFLVFAGLLPRLLGRGLILDIHDSVPETYGAKFGIASGVVFDFLRLEEMVCCSLANRIICVNHVQQEALIKRGIPSDKITTILSMPRFSSHKGAADQHKSDQVFRMVFHGTMSKRLGVDLIIEAVAELVRKIPGFELHIYGDGDDAREIVHLSRSLGVSDCVHFHGAVPWDRLPVELKTMDVGIVANRRNAATELMLPSKLIDYVTLDIPAIVPRLKAIRYYFSEDMVSYFEPENVSSMVSTIMELYGDTARRERQIQAARQFVDKYGWEKHQGSLTDLYNDLG